MKKQKGTKKLKRKLDRMEEHAKTIEQGRKLLDRHAREIRVDTLTELLGMVDKNIVIDAFVLSELIARERGEGVEKEKKPTNGPVLTIKDTDLTIKDLSRETGIHVDTIRMFLAREFPKQAPGKGGKWKVTHKMAVAVFTRWPGDENA